jgi:hypothetical protein
MNPFNSGVSGRIIPRPYFQTKRRSQTSMLGMLGTRRCERYIARVNSWYDTPSFTKRRPAELTAMSPGFDRSKMMCGYTAVDPSLRLAIELGNQNALSSPGGPSEAPMPWASSSVSPTQPSNAEVYSATGFGK